MNGEGKVATGIDDSGTEDTTAHEPIGAVDPSTGQRIVGESRWPMAIAVVTLMVFALAASSHLTFFPGPLLALIEGVLLLAILFGDPGAIDRQTSWLRAATVALVAGAKVWLGNNVAFALLYWAFDCGGPAARAHGMPRYPDLAFPQQTSPDLAPPGWRPQFIDYLYVGFTTANAFSPTDTMPMVPWAKIAMGSQALISFAIVGLVLARVVNLFQ